MQEPELRELADDIKTNGLQQPIELLDGQIIDGRNRYLACQMAGVEPAYVTPEIHDAVIYIISRNLHRRHLTPSQKAMVAARAREYFDDLAKRRQAAGGGDKMSAKAKAAIGGRKALVATLPQALPGPKTQVKARDQAGAAIGVSGRSVEKATKILKEGLPELVRQVESGHLDVTKAARIAKLPKDQQQMLLEDAKANDWSSYDLVEEAKRLEPPRVRQTRPIREEQFDDMRAWGELSDWLTAFLQRCPKTHHAHMYAIVQAIFKKECDL